MGAFPCFPDIEMPVTTLLATLLVLNPATALLPLTTRGTSIVDSHGTPFSLRGANLGSWFVPEMWMTPWKQEPPAGSKLPKIEDAFGLWNCFETRLGANAMNRVRNSWRSNWITPSDFARIKAAGMNHVRIPFSFTLLDEIDGLTTLRRAVDEAAKTGLYSVLDMHGVPGGQNGDHTSGHKGQNELWFKVENITRMESYWTRLGREFGNDPKVAMFDLMNEPFGAPNPAMLHLVYDRVIRAVRKVAPTKILLVDDGYKGFETTPHPNLARWTNVVFSLHLYNFDAKSTSDQIQAVKGREAKVKELQGFRDSPLYIGEFNLEPHGDPASMRAVINEFDSMGWSWAIWTYKAVNANGPMGQWGIFRMPGKIAQIDPFTDDEATTIARIKTLRTERLEACPRLLETFAPK